VAYVYDDCHTNQGCREWQSWGSGWFTLGEANVSYDHPFEAPFEHALSLDFVDEALLVREYQ
jgi:hypothetical protein